MILCKCDCGNETTIQLSRFVNGITSSCGCLRLERVKSLNKRYEKITGQKLPEDFSFRKSRIYGIWTDMLHRCTNPAEKNYYGKGITVCKEWQIDFFNFYFWAMKNGYTDDLTIDRINTLGNYEPSNCRWADVFTQANNRTTNKDIGISMTMAELARKNGIKYSTLKYRIERCGMTAEEAVTCTMHNPKIVLRYDMNGNFIDEFPSARAAAIFLGGGSSTSTHIRDVCTGRRKSALDYIFKYKEK